MLSTDNDNKDRLQMLHVVASATQRGVRWVHSSGKKEEEGGQQIKVNELDGGCVAI